jgi:hypothetical protein
VARCLEPAISGSRISSTPDFIDGYCDQSTLVAWSLDPSCWAIACRSLSLRSSNISLGALLLCGERIEIDELRIVLTGIASKPFAAMNVHQGLHTPGI